MDGETNGRVQSINTFPYLYLTALHDCGSKFDQSFNGRCYYHGKQTKTFSQAEAACEARGGKLASVHNKAENDFIHGKPRFITRMQ